MALSTARSSQLRATGSPAAPRRPVLMTFHGHLLEPAGLNERIDNCLRPLGIDALRISPRRMVSRDSVSIFSRGPSAGHAALRDDCPTGRSRVSRPGREARSSCRTARWPSGRISSPVMTVGSAAALAICRRASSPDASCGGPAALGAPIPGIRGHPPAAGPDQDLSRSSPARALREDALCTLEDFRRANRVQLGAFGSAVIAPSGEGGNAGLDASRRPLAAIESARQPDVAQARRAHEEQKVIAKARLQDWKLAMKEARVNGKALPPMPPDEPEPFVAQRALGGGHHCSAGRYSGPSAAAGTCRIADEPRGDSPRTARGEREFWLQAWNGGGAMDGMAGHTSSSASVASQSPSTSSSSASPVECSPMDVERASGGAGTAFTRASSCLEQPPGLLPPWLMMCPRRTRNFARR